MIEIIVSNFWRVLMLVLLTLLLGWLPWRTFSSGRDQILVGKRLGAWALTTCLIFPIYYLSLLAFSRTVFPFIPAVRGGGDYSVAPKVLIYRTDHSQRASPTPVILLEETATTLFVANPNDAGGPCEWRLGPENKPEVLMISRQDITQIKFLSPSNAYLDCSKGYLTALIEDLENKLTYLGCSKLDSRVVIENLENVLQPKTAPYNPRSPH